MKGVKIICNNTDCFYNVGGYTAHDHSYEAVCHNPDGVIISAKKGCQTKTLKCTLISTLDISIRALNCLKYHNIDTVEQLKEFINTDAYKHSRVIGNRTRLEITELLATLNK